MNPYTIDYLIETDGSGVAFLKGEVFLALKVFEVLDFWEQFGVDDVFQFAQVQV
jgi:hypothetical protein